MLSRPVAALPTGERRNPAQITEDGWFSNAEAAELVTYVLAKDGSDRPTRMLTSYGDVGWTVGQHLDLRHDQTGGRLGRPRVVSIVTYDNYAKPHIRGAADVNRRLPHLVVK